MAKKKEAKPKENLADLIRDHIDDVTLGLAQIKSDLPTPKFCDAAIPMLRKMVADCLEDVGFVIVETSELLTPEWQNAPMKRGKIKAKKILSAEEVEEEVDRMMNRG